MAYTDEVNKLYKRIHGLLMLQGKSIAQMCGDTGISRATMSNLKLGKTTELRYDTLAKIANYLDMSVDELLDDVNVKTEPQPIISKSSKQKDQIARLLSYSLLLFNRQKLCDLVDAACDLSDQQINSIISLIKGFNDVDTNPETNEISFR